MISSVLMEAQNKLSPEELIRLRAREEEEMENRILFMKSLYREIEGLQKALPEMPLRQLIHDGSSSRIWEIDANSYKQKDIAFIHVVSDAIVIAALKKNLLSGKNRLCIDKILPIQEIGFIDIKDSPELMNAFKIIHGTETYMFRAETLQEKRSLLGVITKITGELVAQKKLQLSISKNSPTTANLPTSPQAAQTPKLSNKKQVQDGLSESDYRWLLELSDELDVLIAQRDFGQAITWVEKGNGPNALMN
jgi:hypothetical protein